MSRPLKLILVAAAVFCFAACVKPPDPYVAEIELFRSERLKELLADDG